jgi:hypothetical protein
MRKPSESKVSVKSVPFESSAEDAIEDGFNTLEELKEEISEGVENQRDHAGIAATSRFQTMEETLSTLEEVVDARPEWCPSIDNDISMSIRCTYRQNRSKGLSRRDRRDNATAALAAAVDALRDWALQQGTLVEALQRKSGPTEEEKIEIADRDEELIQTQIEEAEELADTLEEQQSLAEDADFPGMRG